MMRETRYAILIGNRHYPFDEHLVDLDAPERDVDGVADVLGDPQIGRFHDVRRLKTMPHRDILGEVQRVFLQAQKDDLVLFYFSGHGLFDEQGRLHLAVMNTQASLLRVTSLPLATIKEMIDACRSIWIVLMLDCCFSGIRGSRVDPEAFAHYMQLMSSGRGKYIMTSSPHHYDPQEKNVDTYSPFTQHLIDGLKTGLADINREGTITADSLYHYIYTQVASRLGHSEPMKWDLNGKGSCILAWTTPTSSSAATTAKVRYDAIVQLFKKGEIIPFLGPGVVDPGAPGGPPINGELAQRLADRVGLADRADPLTLMSQKMHILAGRGVVYHNLRDLYQPEPYTYSPALTHRFLACIPQPLLILSTAYDTLLEEAFDEVHKKYVVVTHILHAEHHTDKGKVVVQYSDRKKQVEKCLSEELVIDLETWSVIYKIHGTFGLLDPDTEEEIDSIVISEEDYIALVTILDHPQTTIPNHLARQFKKRMFLFLGYRMNDWNFRAVIDLIQRKGNFRRIQPYAVRKDASEFERLYWENKQVRLIETDVSEFVREITGAMGIVL
jgi:hypothetical protein